MENNQQSHRQGFLIKMVMMTGIVKTVRQAQIILLAVSGMCLFFSLVQFKSVFKDVPVSDPKNVGDVALIR